MLSIPQLNELVTHAEFGKTERLNSDILKRRDVYFGMSLHIDGACPAYWLRRNPWLGWIEGNIFQKRPLFGWYGIEYQIIFDEQHFNRYPYEPEIMRQWRYSTYKPFQKAFFDKCISMVTGAIFQDNEYTVTVTDKNDNDYIWGNNFDGKNLVGYLSGKFNTICADPNGMFVVMPRKSVDDTTGNEIEPFIFFVCSKELRYVTHDEIIFEREEEKDRVRWAVNRVGYFRWEKVGENWVQRGVYYPHMLGYVPAFVAGGRWNNQGFYESWLQAAKPIADNYIIIKSDEALCAKEASHPFILEADTDCPDCDGKQKISSCNRCHRRAEKCTCEDGTQQLVLETCTRCGGTGGVSRNPGERMIVPKENMKDDLIKIVNIPVDANKMHAERAKDAEANLKEALHLNYIEQAQSGKAKEKDMETRYQFMRAISDDYFDRLIPMCVNAVTAMRNIRVENEQPIPTSTELVIVKPTQFEVKGTYDLLDEMKIGKESGIPSYQYAVLVEQYADKQSGGNDVLQRKTCLINQMDKFANISLADLNVAIVGGYATQRDGQFKMALPIILDRIVRERGADWFVKADYDQIYPLVEGIFNADYPPITPPADLYTEQRVNV